MTPAKSSLLLLSALALLVAAFHWRAASTSAATPFAAPGIPSLPDALDALHASGRPEDAFAAFALVTDCLFYWMAKPFRQGLSEDDIALAQAGARAIREASDARIGQERERQGLPPLKAGAH